MELEQTIGTLLALYYDVYPMMERIETTIVLTDDLDRSHRELRPDLIHLIDRRAGRNVDGNGRLVLPASIDEKIYVLLDINKIVQYTQDQTMTWVGTLAHEHTHAIDFYQMARLKSLENYDSLEQLYDYRVFQLWSEYHARKLGYGFLRKFLAADEGSLSREERIDHIKNYEWPHHQADHFRDYHMDGDGYQQMYITMQLLGRYSVWCDLFPEVFNEKTLEETYEDTPWMHHLFSFLRQHETLEMIYGNFDAMRVVLQENWSGI